jgi:hypothetical protein
LFNANFFQNSKQLSLNHLRPIFSPLSLRKIVGIRTYLGFFSSSSSVISLLALFKIFFKPKTGLTFFISPSNKKIGFIVIFFKSLKKIKNSFSTYSLFPLTINLLITFGTQKELNK